MGHYDSSYEHDADEARKVAAEANERARKLIMKAMEEAHPASEKNFKDRLMEAIFWMGETNSTGPK